MQGELSSATWADLTEEQPKHTKTWMELNHWLFDGSIYGRWLDEGVLVLDFSRDERFMYLLDRYSDVRARLPRNTAERDNYWAGWASPTPYLNSMEMLDVGLYEGMTYYLNALLGENALLHLALTGWVSTERNWHQDSYLNPNYVWSSYVAAWIALDDIHPDSGPFQYVPGSHRWEVLRREKLFKFIDDRTAAGPDWPSITQGEVARVCEEKSRAMGAELAVYTPKKGQILFWHSNLIHRGSAPNNPELIRKALILHYSGVSKRIDMNPVNRLRNGFYYQGTSVAKMG